MAYHFACQCGLVIPAETWHCGMEVTCPACGSRTRVPDLITLKRQSGDAHPHLSPLEKIAETLKRREAPFHGICHGCNQSEAEFEVPITMQIMAKRTADRGGHVAWIPMMGFTFLSAKTSEQWDTVTFPLLLCEPCRTEFVRNREAASFRKIAGIAVLVGLLLLIIGLLQLSTEFAAVFLGVALLLAVVASTFLPWLVQRSWHTRTKARVARWLVPWLEKIRWAPEALAGEDEYRVHVGSPQRTTKNAT